VACAAVNWVCILYGAFDVNCGKMLCNFSVGFYVAGAHLWVLKNSKVKVTYDLALYYISY